MPDAKFHLGIIRFKYVAHEHRLTVPLVRLKLVTSQSQVKHSTSEPLSSSIKVIIINPFLHQYSC